MVKIKVFKIGYFDRQNLMLKDALNRKVKGKNAGGRQH